MFITDSQIHLWAANTPQRPWPARHAPHRPIPLEAPEMLREMDAAGVARAVVVPPSWEGDRNDVALAAAQAHPDRFAVMGRISPDAVDTPENRTMLANWRKQPGMLGLRFTFHWPEIAAEFTSGKFEWVWEAAGQAGLPIMALLPHTLMHVMDGVAQRHPGLKITLDHLGLNNLDRDDHAFEKLDLMLALAKRPNVAVKSSAVPVYSTAAYPYSNIHSYLKRVYDAFGPKRMFWGSDITRLPCSYKQSITMFTDELKWLSDSDKEWIMSRGISDWLGWPASAA